MLENQVGKRYAEALSVNISDTGMLEKALESLKAFKETMKAEPQLEKIFKHPSIPLEKKKNLALFYI